MRKIFSLLAAVLFAGSMMAGSYTITFKDNGEGKGDGTSSMSSTNVDDYVAEGAEYFSAVAATGKVFLGQDGYGLKFGNSSNAGSITLTLVTPVTPTSIVMNASPWSATEGSGLLQDSTFATKSTGAKGTFADFTYVYDGKTEVTTIIVGTQSKRGYVKSITVNYEGGVTPPAVAAPAIAGEANFFDSTTITITCATEGAAIYYTLDGSEPNNQSTAYTAPFQLKETATVKAFAQKDTDLSAVVSKTFTKNPSFDSFEALVAAQLANNTLVEVSFENIKIDSIYTSSKGKKQGLYFTVGSTAYEIYYNKAEVPETWEVGGTVSGTIRGNWTEYKSIWEIVPSADDWAWALTYKAAAPVVHTYTVAGAPAALFGNEWAPSDANNDMTPMLGGDLYVWRKDSVNLTAGDIEFKVCEDHGWDKAYPAQNYKLNIAEAGYYNILIRFNPKAEPDSMIKAGATKVGEAPQPADVWDEITFTKATAAGVFNDTVFTVEGSEFSLKCVDTDGKLKTTANNASFGTVEDRHDYAFRLQTSGKSSSKNNMELNIPADGQLRFAVRTATASDETRTVVLVQGTDTIYNKVAVDKDTVKGASNPRIFNFAYVNVKAGKVAVSYPVNGVNFYSFAFKADVVPPTPEHTYTVAGAPATLFGTAWAPANEANDMKPITGSKYLYAWEKDSVALTAGDIEFKVCEDHAWTKAWPAQNYKLNIAEAGLYKVSIFFNPEFGDSAVYAMAEKKGEAKVLPNIILHGNFTGTWADTDPFVAAQDSLTASLTLALAAGNYEFGFKFDGTWKANGANLTREDNTANLSTGEGNMHITADVPGNYVFTYTYETQGVVVTYPEPIIVPDTIDVTMSSLTAPGSLIWDDEVATDGWWQIMGGNDTCAFSLSNGNEITTAAGTYTVDDLDAKYSYLTIVKANDTIEVAFVDGSITVAVDEVGVVTVVGALLGNDGNVYKFNLTYVEPKAETTVNVNIAEGKMNDVYAGYGLYGVYGTDTTANVFVQLAIWAEDGFQGNFTEKDLDFKYVGSGIVEGLTAPKIYTAAITVTPGNLEGEYSITADLLCYNNTLYKVTMTISAAQGIDAVEAATKAIKSLQNGILTIEKAGKTYNVNGTLIR